jgi:hypothetical protein
MQYEGAKALFATLLSITVLLTAMTARADEFMDACMMNGASNPDTPRICNCMSANVSQSDRANAAAALRQTNQSMATGGMPVDPSTLPAHVQKGLQAIVLAQAQCM